MNNKLTPLETTTTRIKLPVGQLIGLVIILMLTGCAGSPDIYVSKNVTVNIYGDSNQVELLYEQLSETTVEAQVDQTTKGTLKLPLP